MTRTQKVIYWVVKVIPAIILLQTLFYKFTGHEVSVYIFEQVGLGNIGRIGSGVVELIAGILLIIPKTSWAGSLLALGTIAGAIFFHLTRLGIEVLGDGGQLFIMAIIVFLTSLLNLWIERGNIRFPGIQFA